MDRKKWIWLILGVFFLIRIAASFFINAGISPGDDSVQYNNYACAILEDFKWLHSPNVEGNRREPGYPIFLALVYFLFGKDNFLAVYVLQAFINVFTIFIIYKLALKIFDERVALIAFIWSGLYGFYLWFSAHILREVLIYFLLAVLFYSLYACFTSPTDRRANIFAISLLFFLLTHTDARYFYLLPCIGILFVTYQNFSGGVKKFLLFLLVVTVLSIPWGIRNYIVWDSFIKIEERWVQPIRYIVDSEVREQWSESKDTEKDAGPTGTLRHRYWHNSRELFRPFMFHDIYIPSPTRRLMRWSLRHNLLSIMSYGFFLPFMLAGTVMLIAKKDKNLYFLLLPLLFHISFHVILWAGEYRFRIPMDFFLIILGGYGIVLIYDFFARRKVRA